jgi:hypothetical protein
VAFRVRGVDESRGKSSDASRLIWNQFSFTAFSIVMRRKMKATTETARPLKRKVT